MILLFVGVSLASALTYEQMARYPDDNQGESVTLYGKAVDPDYSSSEGWGFRLYTKESDYGGSWYENDVYVVVLGAPSGPRVLEDDMVTVTGTYAKPFSYKTILGGTRTIPGILGTRVTIG